MMVRFVFPVTLLLVVLFVAALIVGIHRRSVPLLALAGGCMLTIIGGWRLLSCFITAM